MRLEFRSFAITDGHIHYGHPQLMVSLQAALADNAVGRCNIVCTPHRTRLSLVPDALHLKAHFPGQVYVFGGLDISPLFMDREHCGAHFARYLDTLAGMGCDGVKMIEGKPDMRKQLPVPDFDSPAYAPYWEKMEEKGLPLVFHVNDPEEFWDEQLIPGWARKEGWFYGDGSYVNNEAQYTQVLNVLRRHPGLKVIFAHFFFLSNQLERLAGYLDEFPGMNIDLTPGIEMYFHFSRQPERAREFFLKYKDRIVFGTDIGAKALLATPDLGIEPDESRARVQVVRGFLECDGPYKLDLSSGYLFGKFGGDLKGICLPADALEKIYHGNFERLAGAAPRPVNPAAVAAECERLAFLIPIMTAAQPGPEGDTSVAEMVSSYFRAQEGV